MPAASETPRIRLALIVAMTAVVPVMICMMIAFISVTQTAKASLEALEAVLQIAGGAEVTEESMAITETVKRFQYELMNVSAKTRLILMLAGGVSILIILLLVFAVAKQLGGDRGMSGGRTGPLPREEVARVLERVAVEVRAGRIDTHLV